MNINTMKIILSAAGDKVVSQTTQESTAKSEHLEYFPADTS